MSARNPDVADVPDGRDLGPQSDRVQVVVDLVHVRVSIARPAGRTSNECSRGGGCFGRNRRRGPCPGTAVPEMFGDADGVLEVSDEAHGLNEADGVDVVRRPELELRSEAGSTAR